MRHISRLKITEMVGKKLGYKINRFHIRAIVGLLVDEIIAELISGGQIKIDNFGMITLNKLKPRRIREVNSGKLKIASRTKAIRFKIDKNLNKYLVQKVFEKLLGDI
jgi:nucleoid DNA-binding protein